MAISNAIPILWSDKIFQANNEAIVAAQLTNKEYEGEIKAKGDQVKIVQFDQPTAYDYSGTVNFEELNDSAQILHVDQYKVCSPIIPDLANVQSIDGMPNEILRLTGVELAEVQDTFILSKYVDAGITIGSTGAPISLTSANVVQYVADMVQKFDENSVPQSERVAIVPPFFINKLFLSKNGLDTNNSDNLANGFKGSINGITFFQSNLLGTNISTWTAPMFFRAGDTIAHANQLTDLEQMRPSGTIGTVLRAQMVYGTKVTRPSSLGVIYCAPGAES